VASSPEAGGGERESIAGTRHVLSKK